MLTKILAELAAHPFAICTVLFIAYYLNNRYGHRLSKYPGPTLAAWTNWWRFWDVWRGHHEWTQIKLHRTHGDVVRLGPNLLSFANPDAIKDIYGLNKGYTKTYFYPVQAQIANGRTNYSLFSTLDESFHAHLRRRVNSAFAMSTLISYEPLVNQTLDVFLMQTRKLFVERDVAVDLARWLQFLAFDVIGQISFSKRLGFIDHNQDVEGIVGSIADTLEYSGKVGQQPWLDRYFFRKNPLKLMLMRLGFITAYSPIAKFAAARQTERKRQIEKQGNDEVHEQDDESMQDNVNGVDFLARFLAAQRKDPDFMDDFKVLSMVSSLVNAGSDTTGISMSSVFYHLCKYPKVYAKLQAELDDAVERGDIVPDDNGVVSWSDAQKLRYLDAVIQESFRLFPAVGLLLERHVPQGGAVICGEHIPEGTIVGCNAWVLHRRAEVFGEDVDDFRPERWLDVDTAKRSQMSSTMFQFGAGARTCIGKHISLLEIYKLVPSFLLNFKVHLADPDKDWKTKNCWFVRQLGFKVRIKART